MHRKMVKEVEPLTEELFQAYNDIGMPIVISFVNFGKELPKDSN